MRKNALVDNTSTRDTNTHKLMNRNTAQLVLLILLLVPPFPAFLRTSFSNTFSLSLGRRETCCIHTDFPVTALSSPCTTAVFFFFLLILLLKQQRKDCWIDRGGIGVTGLDLRLTSGWAHSLAQIVNSGFTKEELSTCTTGCKWTLWFQLPFLRKWQISVFAFK